MNKDFGEEILDGRHWQGDNRCIKTCIYDFSSHFESSKYFRDDKKIIGLSTTCQQEWVRASFRNGVHEMSSIVYWETSLKAPRQKQQEYYSTNLHKDEGCSYQSSSQELRCPTATRKALNRLRIRSYILSTS